MKNKNYRMHVRKSTFEICFYFKEPYFSDSQHTWKPIYKALKNMNVKFNITFPKRKEMILKFSDLESLTLAKLVI